MRMKLRARMKEENLVRFQRRLFWYGETPLDSVSNCTLKFYLGGAQCWHGSYALIARLTGSVAWISVSDRMSHGDTSCRIR